MSHRSPATQPPEVTPAAIRELSEFKDQAGCALSFYFHPSTPRDKTHREDVIRAKDLVRDALHRLNSRSSRGQTDTARTDLEHIARSIGDFRSNGVHSKAIFACAAMGWWREYDLPAHGTATQLLMDRGFHLKPLVQILGAFPGLCIVVLDRHRARLFELRLGELFERKDLFHPTSRRGRSDGFAGYDGGHAQRRRDDEARQHFKNIAEVLKQWQENGFVEKWIVACSDVHWSQLEPQLHPYVKKQFLGRCPGDVGHIVSRQLRTNATRMFDDWREKRSRELISDVLDQARATWPGRHRFAPRLAFVGIRRNPDSAGE